MSKSEPENKKYSILLVLPTLEQNLDPHDLHSVHYNCSLNALIHIGRTTKIVDPRNIAQFQSLILSPEFQFIITERSQSSNWPRPRHGTKEFAIYADKILITFAGNPPFYEGSLEFHKSIFRNKIMILHDHDSIPYAESINISGARIIPGHPMYHDVDLEDEARWKPASRRQIPILFVGTYMDPEAFRSSWRQAFGKFPKPLASIEAAAELLSADLTLPVWRALSQAVETLDVEFDIRSPAGRTALKMLSGFANHRVRQSVLDRVSRYPSRIVATALPPLRSPHRDCIVSPVASFSSILNMMKDAMCLVTTNPNGMTGAVSERVPNAMRRGAVVMHTPNNTLRHLKDAGIVVLDNQMDDLEAQLDSAAAGDASWDALGESARKFAEAHYRMDDMYDTLLQAASDPEPTNDPWGKTSFGTGWR